MTALLLLRRSTRVKLHRTNLLNYGQRARLVAPFSSQNNNNDDLWDKNRVNAFIGHSFPDFIEGWNRSVFRKVGYGLNLGTAATLATTAVIFDLTASLICYIPAVFVTSITAVYWKIGLQDISQKSHAIRRNYPVLGNLRYIMETIRPELRQYIVESDDDGKPFNRLSRARVYQRAKNVNDTLPFGTRRNVYETHHEWACQSLWPKTIPSGKFSDATRTTIGTSSYGTTKPYSASVLNISAMSYGAISDNAILALNQGAKLGNFYHNTGEGGISSYHRQGGGDIVWNIGTGYFGCGSGTGIDRVFDPIMLKDTIDESKDQIKMIEIKLSQGAKPGHGGLLPMAKITPEIAKARKLPYPPESDCHSPARHSAFSNPYELMEFIAQVREHSGGLPVGIKLCVGQPGEFASLCKSILAVGNGPDFITVDGAEGGTGAAPPELSDSVGLPLEEGLVLVRNMLVGSGLKDKTAIVASGRIASAFSLVRTIALGADATCAARAFMLSLGCIQALKCNTNHCPTGIATQDKNLMYGLDPQDKTHRVYHYHRKTVLAASDIVGIMGYDSFEDVKANDIMRRVQHNQVRTLSEHFPECEAESLLKGNAPGRLQETWDHCEDTLSHVSVRRWIY